MILIYAQQLVRKKKILNRIKNLSDEVEGTTLSGVMEADDFKFTANNFSVLSGSTLTIDSGATITNSGTANGFGVSTGKVIALSMIFGSGA